MPKPLGIDNQWDRLAQHRREIDRVKARGHGSWHYVGDKTGTVSTIPDPVSPDWLNGWDNAGGTLQKMRFRWLLGGGIEVQGSVSGGTPGQAAFQLPAGYKPDHDLRLAGSDDTGAFMVFQVLANGLVIPGI